MYKFHKVFDEDSKQSDVFDNVAKPVINSVLQGYNGTIFAYGQTGSGKTYTITGSPKNYNDRGIIPRSLQYIFEQNEKLCLKPTIYISYMEIYNEIGYDLLSPRHNTNAKGLEELPRIALLEDGKGEAHIRNLSVLPVTTEQEAMRLLFLGDTNRTIAETPVNEYSSRSHCIFTIHITFRKETSSLIRFAKLHIVDLAGSERVSKSLTTGTALNEAKYINLSLHYLQQVIVALSEEKRLHIPYRNSMMTYILKDSLSGNSLTVMMATIAVTKNNLQETISTCKFAQRVSLITTEPVINELKDPQQEIIILRRRIEELEKHIAELTGITAGSNLNDEQKEQCEKEVEDYLRSAMAEEEFMVKPNLKQIQYCFKLFKLKINSHNKINEQQKLENHKIQKEMSVLKNSVQERNSEITTLKNIIDQIPEKPTNPDTANHIKDKSVDLQRTSSVKEIEEKAVTNSTPKAKNAQLKQDHSSSSKVPPLNVYIGDTLMNEKEKGLFQQFMANRSNSKDLLYYTQSLEKKYQMAKIYADRIERCQQKIIDIRQRLQVCPNDVVMKTKLLSELEKQQDVYSRALVDLKLLKSETRHLQSGLEQAQIKIRQRFEIWLNEFQSSKANSSGKEDQWGNYDYQFGNQYYKKQDTSGAENYFKQDSYATKLKNIFDYNDHPCQYNNSSGAPTGLKLDPLCGKKMDQQLAGQFGYDNMGQFNNQKVTGCGCGCYTCASNGFGRSQGFGADFPRTPTFIPELMCPAKKTFSKSYIERSRSRAGKECCLSPSKSYHCIEQIYRNAGNTFINTDQLCNSIQLPTVDFQGKTVIQHEMPNCQLVNRDYTCNRFSTQMPENKMSFDLAENRTRYCRRNGLEEATKETYVHHKKNVVVDCSIKYKMRSFAENYKSDVDADNILRSQAFTNLPSCKDEAVKETPHPQDQTKPENSTGLIENVCAVDTNQCLFKATDSPEFVEFMKTVPLTGEADIDEEIFNFYRNKLH